MIPNCTKCGKFISTTDIKNKAAKVTLLTTDGYFTEDESEVFVKIYLCKRCNKIKNNKKFLKDI